MSTATPTLIPRSPVFPNVLPMSPQPHPVPFPPYGYPSSRIPRRRDLHREMIDLSDEEQEMDDLNEEIKNRGASFLIPIGRLMTQQEEKNDADEDEDDGDGSHTTSESSEPSEEAPSEEENESEQDLDADMEDMDEEGNMTAETAESDEMDDEDQE